MAATAGEVAGLVQCGVTTGREALSILNRWIDSEQTAKTWYGKELYDAFAPNNRAKGLIRQHTSDKPEIQNVFTVKKDHWPVIFQEALPVAHTWFRAKKDNEYECWWIPRYKSCKEALGKQGGDGVLAKIGMAFSSLGIVLNRPAAHLELWGLVVMAYSNGSWRQMMSSTDGGFRAILHAKNFVLTVSQSDVNSPATGNLEPREHPAENREPLGNLPRNFVEGRWDKQLKKVALDHFAAYDLGKRIRDAITEYRAKWIQERHLRATVPQTRQKEGANVVEAHPVNRDEIDGPYPSETDVGNLPTEQAKGIESLGSLIDVQHWRIKLLFYDELDLVDNLNRRDALEMFREQGQLLEKIITFHEKDHYFEHSKKGGRIAKKLRKLLHQHHIVTAMTRMLFYPLRIDKRLSTRNTGSNVLLA